MAVATASDIVTDDYKYGFHDDEQAASSSPRRA